MLGHRFMWAGESTLFLTLCTVKTCTLSKVSWHIEHDVVPFHLAANSRYCKQETHSYICRSVFFMLFLTLCTVKSCTLSKVSWHIEHDVVPFQLAADSSYCKRETHSYICRSVFFMNLAQLLLEFCEFW